MSDVSTFHPQSALNKNNSIKKKGGWPKGKKRKKDVAQGMAPKPPKPGYLIFMTEQRQLMRESHSDLVFSEVTKILGKEWSTMSMEQKQIYLDQAKTDQIRYIRELKMFQNLKVCRNYKKSKNKKFIDCKESEEVSNDQESQSEDENELYCSVCELLFTSEHNKKEHFYGKQHLAKLHSKASCDVMSCNRSEISVKEQGPPTHHLPSTMELVYRLAMDQESEVCHLQKHFEAVSQLKESLQRKVIQMQEDRKKLQLQLDNIKAEGSRLTAHLVSLRMVPTLFGVIHF